MISGYLFRLAAFEEHLHRYWPLLNMTDTATSDRERENILVVQIIIYQQNRPYGHIIMIS